MMTLGEPQVQQGSSGPDVRKLQQFLAVRGFDVGRIDGIFGMRTREAVKAFQRKRGISPDGIVGGETWHDLKQGEFVLAPSRGGPLVPDAPPSAFKPALSTETLMMVGIAVATMFFTGVLKR